MRTHEVHSSTRIVAVIGLLALSVAGALAQRHALEPPAGVINGASRSNLRCGARRFSRTSSIVS